MKMYLKSRKARTILVVVVFILLTGFMYQKYASPASAATLVAQAWQNVERSDSYTFSATIEDTAIPLATTDNIGRFSKTTSLYIEGDNNLRDDELQMAIWGSGLNALDQTNAYQIRIQDDQVSTRVGEETWQPSDNINVGFAPGGDFLAFLDVAMDVRPTMYSEESATEDMSRAAYAIYEFNINGPAYAQQLIRTNRDYLVRTGQLPANVALQGADYLNDITGSGELWIDGRGLPAREIVTLHIPPAQGADYRSEIKLDIQFTSFEGELLAATWQQPGQMVAATLALLSLPSVSEVGFNLFVLSAFSLFAIVLAVPNRRTLRLVNGLLLLTILATPLLQAEAAEETRTQIDRFQAKQEEAPVPPPVLTRPTPYTPALNRDEITAVINRTNIATTAGSLQMDANLNTDNDGLPDEVEALMGANPYLTDTDQDGISDDDEVLGFQLGGEWWYGNPANPDSNNDGVLDTLTWGIDTDGDNTPDLYDDDSDNDNVPNYVDLSPFSATRDDLGAPIAFTRTNPLNLTINGLNQNSYVFVDFQLRPSNPDRLWYAFNVLNWPSDKKGNMQDWDNATFFDYCRATGGVDCTMGGDDNGDIKFIPMLEILLPDLNNVPRTGNGQIDTALLDKYGIGIRPVGDGRYYAYVPLNVVEDPYTGSRAAFQAQMVYQAGLNWGQQQARMVWLVQALNEDYKDEDEAARLIRLGGGIGQNNATILHVYADEFYLTGLNIREDRGVEMAIVYEDPAVDNALEDDDGLMQMATGLERTFFVNRDCDFVDNEGECVGDGERDIDIPEIGRRWNHPTNSGVTLGQRWGIPDQLRVETYLFAHQDEATFEAGSEIAPQILDTHFTDETETANLLYVRELRLRAINADVRTQGTTDVAWTGTAVTVDFSEEAITAQASYNLAPYRYNQSQDGWEPFPVGEYADKLLEEFNETTAGLTEEEAQDPAIVEATATAGTVAVVAIINGSSSVISTNAGGGAGSGINVSLSGAFVGVNLSDEALRFDYITAINTTVNRFIQLARYSNNKLFRNKVIVDLFNLHIGKIDPYAINEGLELANKKAEFDVKVGRFRAGLVVFTSMLFLAGLSSFVALHTAKGKVVGEGLALGVNAASSVIQAVTTVSEVSHFIRKAIPTTTPPALADKIVSIAVMRSGYVLQSAAAKASAVGLVIGVVITWAVFFAAWGKGGIAAGSLEFNNLLAATLATTIVLVLTFFLALTVVGAIIMAIVAVFDLLTFIICKAGAKGACDLGIMAGITKVLTDWIYQGESMIDTSGNPPIVNIEDLRMKLGQPEQGLVVGNSVRFEADMLTWIRHTYPKPSVVYHYGSFFTPADLQSTTIKYQLATAEYNLRVQQGQSIWQLVRPYDIATEYVPSPVVGWLVPTEQSKTLYEGYRLETITSQVYNFSQPKINQQFPLWLLTGMALPRYDCWFSVCSHKTTQTSTNTNLGERFTLDILPATVDGMYFWTQLGPQQDRDNDGLQAILDTHDTQWDRDGDALSDWQEVQFGSNPALANADMDGLTDAQEKRFETNPGRADSDGDGLSDDQEVLGYNLIVDSYTIRVTSNPLSWDTDSDGMSDSLEQRLNQLDAVRFPFHPSVINDPPLRLYTSVNDTDQVLAIGDSATITTTILNGLLSEDDLLVSGRFTATLPTELGSATNSQNFTLLPTSQREIIQAGTAVAGQRFVNIETAAFGRVYPVGSPAPTGQPDIALDEQYAITIDSDNPNAPTLSIGNFVEPDVEVIIGGTASDPTSYIALVEVSVDGGPFVAANGTNLWAFALSIPNQPAGVIPITVRVTDAVGHISSANFNVTIDSVSPVTTLSLAPGETRSLRRDADGRWTLTLNGTSSDALAGIGEVEVRIGANSPITATVAVTDDTWTLVYPFDNLAFNSDPNPNGPLTVTVTTQDNALPGGNATTQEIPFIVDMSPPTVTLLSHEDAAVLSDGTVLTGTVQDNYSAVNSVEIAFVSAETVLATGETYLYLPLNDLPETVLFNNVATEPARIYCLDEACPQSYVSGVDGTAASFNGNDILQNFETLTLPATDLTIALWFNTTCANCGLFSAIQGDFPTITQNDHNLFLDGGKVCSSILTGISSREVRCSVAANYNDGQWHQVVQTLGANGNHLYVDGQLAVSSPTTTSTFNETTGIIAGHSASATTPYFTGQLDDVVVYKGALTPAVAASLYRQWQPVTLIPGNTPQETTWAYTVPSGLEGHYQIDMRAADSLGNRVESRGAWPQLRAPIDTAYPAFDVSVVYSGSGSAAQTRYFANIQDRNLVTDDYTFACALQNDQLVYETDPTLLGFGSNNVNDGQSLATIEAECVTTGYQTSLVSAYACDDFDHCGAATPPQIVAYIGTRLNTLNPIGSLSNAIERTNLSDPRNRVRLIERPGRIIYDIEIDQTNGKLYWSEGAEVAGTAPSGEIWRANLDGTNLQRLHSGLTATLPEMLQIAIDPTGNKLYWTAGYQLYWSNLDGSQTAVIYSVPDDPRIIGGNQQYQAIGDVVVDPLNGKLYISERRNRLPLGTSIFPHSLIVEMTLNGANPAFVAGVAPGCTYANWNDNLGTGVGQGQQPDTCLDETGGMDVESLTVANGVLYWAAYEPGGVNTAVYGKEPGQPPFTVAPLGLSGNTQGINYGPVPHLYANPLSSAVFVQHGTQIVRGEPGVNNSPGLFTLFTEFLDETPPAVGATTRKSSTLTALAIIETGGELQTETDLAVELTSPDLVLVDGDSGSYNLTLRNLGALPAAGTQLTLDLPIGASYAGASQPCTEGGSNVTCDFGRFDPFDTQSVVISFTIATNEVRTLTATATASSSTPDANLADNNRTLATITAAPTLAALPGLPYIYYSVNSTQLVRIPLFGDYKPEPMRFDGYSSVIYQGTGNALAASPDGETLYLFDHTVNLMKIDANGTDRVVLADANPADNEPGFGRNLTTAVDPSTGRIYYAEMVSWYWSRLKSMNPDGSNVQTLNDRVLLVRGLAVDYLRGKLYWIGSDNQMQRDLIYRSNLDGTNVEVVYTAPNGRSLRDLAIDPYAQRLYWVDPVFEGGSLFWADTSGQQVEMLANWYGDTIRGLIVRPEQDALYYITSYALYRSELDGSNEEWLADINTETAVNVVNNLNPNEFFWGEFGPANSNLAYVIASPFPPSACVAADTNEPNDTATTATLITDGSETAALCRPTMDATQDIDYYKINVPAGQQMEITLTNLPADYSLQARQGDGILGTSLNNGLTNEFLAIPNYTGITQTYTLIVYTGLLANNNNPYTLETALVTAPPQTEFTNEQCLMVDPHDQPGTAGNYNQANATPLTVGTVITGALCYKFDSDFYSFSGTAGQAMQATLLTYPANYGLFIYRPDGSFFNAFGPSLFNTPLRLDATGIWKIAVDNQGHPPTMAQYELLVSDTTCGINDTYEPNDLSDQAAPLSSNRRIFATLCSASDADYYNVTTAVANQQLTIDYPANAAGAEIKVTDANGLVLGSVLPGTQRSFTLAPAGTYRLQVANSGLSGSDVAYNFLWQIGNAVSLGEPYIYYGNWPNLARVALTPDHTISPIFLDGSGYGYADYNLVSAPSLGQLYMAGVPQALIGSDYSGFNRVVLPFEPNPDGVAAPVSVAIDEVNGHIFWTQPSGGVSSTSSYLMRGNLDGSDTPYQFPSLILQNQAGLLMDQVRGELYFVSNEAVYRMGVDGTNQVTVRTAVNGQQVRYLTIDALNRYLYWIDSLQGTLVRRSLVDGSESTLVSGLNDNPHGVVVRPEKNELYYSNGTTLYRAALNGTAATAIATFGTLYQGPSNLDPDVYPFVYLGPPNNNMVLGYGSPIVSPCTLADANEPNNDSGSATPTTVITGTVIQAALCYPTTGNPAPDEDYYAVEVADGKVLTATLSNLPADYTLVIIHPDGYAAGFSNNNGLVGEQATVANTSGMTVTYQVVVRTGSFNMSSTPYNLLLAGGDVPPPPNPDDAACGLADGYDAPNPGGNGTLASATGMAFDTSYTAALCYSDDVDMYAFDGLAGQTLTLNLPTRPEDYTLTLYDPNGIATTVISATTSPTYGNSITLPTNGRWTVAVSQPNLTPTTNQYTLLVTDENCVSSDNYEPNNSEGAASAMSNGSRVRATLCSNDDVDLYTFNATAGQELTLNYPVNGGGASLRVYPADGGDLGQVMTGTQGIFTITSSGTYFVEVTNSALSSRAVPYMFQLLLGAPTPPPTGSPYLYDVNSAYLVRADLSTGNVEPILLDNGGTSYLTIASDTVRDYLYVRTVSQQIGRLHPDGTGFEIVVANTNPNGVLRGATGLAVDEQNGRIYWVEPTFGVVGRILSANGDGTDVQEVVPSLVSDQAIVIDPVGGYLYWVENAFYQTSVEYLIGRSNLDGSNPQIIHVAYGRQIQDLALDSYARKLYWVDPTQQAILWMDADGGPADLLLSLGAPGRGLVIRPFEDTIYFSAGDSLRRADLDGSNVSELTRQTGEYTGISNLDPGVFFPATFIAPQSNLVLAYAEPFAAPCAAVDSYEPNNTMGEAAVIEPGTFSAALCTADFNTPDVFDYYQLEVANSQQISVTLSQLPQDYALFLSAGGNGVTWSYNPGLADEFVTHINNSGGPVTYTIGVHLFAGNDSRQPYTMTVEVATIQIPPPPPPPADACAGVDSYDAPGYEGNWNRDQATLINYNMPITAALCYAADKDYYAFDGVLGQNVTINLSPRPADYYITLYDPNGNYTTGIFPGSFLDYGGEYTLSATGRWAIAVWYPYLAPTPEQYTLELTFDSDCFGADPYEPNNEYYSNPTQILSRTLTLRNILCQSGGNDLDYYTFPVLTGERIRITPRTLAAGMEMSFQVPGFGFGSTTEPIDFIANNDGDFLLGFYIYGGMWQYDVDNVPYVVDIQIDPVPTPPTTPNNWTCNTYSSGPVSMPITDLATFGLTLNVPVTGAVTHVGLRDLTLEHDWLIDVSFGLQSPDGTTEELFAFDDYGFYTWCGNDDCQLSLDDWAQSGLVPPQFPTTGDTYLPSRGSFSVFDGVESSGNWTLLVTDGGPSGDFGEGYQITTGTMKGWGLEVCVDNGNPPDPTPPPPPAPTPDPEPGDTTPPGNTDPLETPPATTPQSCVAALPDAYESDDLAASASTFILASLTSSEHTFHTVTDADWMAFDAIAGLEYSFTAVSTQPASYTSLTIFEPDGTTTIVVGSGAVTFQASTTATYYLRANWSGGITTPCDYHYSVAAEVVNPNILPVPEPNGTPAPPTLDQPIISSAIIAPSHQQVFTEVAPISLEIGLSANNGITAAVLLVNGTPQADYTVLPGLPEYDSIWYDGWTPAASGVYTLTILITDTNGVTATSPANVVYVDTADPTVTITAETITQAKLGEAGLYALRGTVNDDTAVNKVEVQINGGTWQEAVLNDNEWLFLLTPLAQANPDGGTLNINARATDVADRTATTNTAMILDVVAPDAFAIATSLTNGDLISPTLVTAGLNSRLAWPSVITGSDTIYAGWTAVSTPTLNLLTAYGTGPGLHDELQTEATVRYAHVIAVDVNGNETAVTSGPFYFDTAQTPDLISDLALANWVESGGKQVGQTTTAVYGTQQLFVGWNEDALRLRWQGLNVNGDSDLYLYLGTSANGATALLNPFSINQPGVLPFVADYAIHVSDSLTATLYTINNGTLSAVGPVAIAALGQTTDLLLPFADLGITDPAGATLRLLGLAASEGNGEVWATIPDKNLGQVWAQYIEWGSLGSGIIPAAGVWANTSIEAVVAANPDPATLVAAGDTVTLTLTYSNTGSANLPQLTFSGTGSGVSLTNAPQAAVNVPAGGTGVLTLIGTVNTNGSVNVTLADSYHQPYLLDVFTYTVDTLAPISVAVSLDYVGAVTNTILASAEDASPLALMEVEADDGNNITLITCLPGDGTEDAFVCLWNPGAVSDGETYTLRARAMDVHGNMSNWSNYTAVEADATLPLLTFSTETQVALGDGVLNANEMTLVGTLVDERTAVSTLACLGEISAGNCVSAEVLPDNSWTLPLPGSYKGITATLMVAGFDGAANSSTPFIQTVWLDTVAPVISTTVTPALVTYMPGTAALMGSGTVIDASNLSAARALIILPDGSSDTVNGQVNGNTWEVSYLFSQEGVHEAVVILTDGAGNQRLSPVWQFTAESTGVVPQPDIQVTGFTANGNNTITIAYTVADYAAPSFTLGFYTSADNAYQSGDALLSTITINNPTDLAVGSHVKSYALGTGAELVNTANETDLDYYILAVADAANAIAETDSEPHNEDNTAVFSGVYHQAGQPVFVHGGETADTVTATGSSILALTLTFNGTPVTYSTATTLRIRTHGNNDTVNLSGITLTNASFIPFLVGGAGNDTLIGSNAEDTLVGGPGNDTLNGGGLADTASYADSPVGTVVNLTSSTASDGYGGIDSLTNINHVIGSAFPDTLTGNMAANILTGNGGNDNLDGQRGNDILVGGPGNDLLIGGNGADTANYATSPTGVTASLSGGTATQDGFGATDTLVTLENLTGSAYGDSLTGDNGRNTLSGGDGPDTLVGGAGADTLQGMAGNDTLYANSPTSCSDGAVDRLIGGLNSDTGYYNTTPDNDTVNRDVEIKNTCS